MGRKEILDTITVLCSKEEVAEETKRMFLGSTADLSPLKDTTIIAVENTSRGEWLQKFDGINIAHEILTKNPNAKIILYHACPLFVIRQKNKYVDMVLIKPNVRLVEIATISIEGMISIFDTANPYADTTLAAASLNTYIADQLGTIWHDIKYVTDPLNPKADELSRLEAAMEKTKKVFPALADKNTAFIIEFLKEASMNRPEIRKGEVITGLFCDMEGTLFVNGILNESVLNYLKKAEVHPILWTDGNITELSELLKKYDIHYPLYTKRSYAGAIVEKVIDDMDEVSFTATTKIYPQKFIRAQDITS